MDLVFCQTTLRFVILMNHHRVSVEKKSQRKTLSWMLDERVVLLCPSLPLPVPINRKLTNPCKPIIQFAIRSDIVSYFYLSLVCVCVCARLPFDFNYFAQYVLVTKHTKKYNDYVREIIMTTKWPSCIFTRTSNVWLNLEWIFCAGTIYLQ